MHTWQTFRAIVRSEVFPPPRRENNLSGKWDRVSLHSRIHRAHFIVSGENDNFIFNARNKKKEERSPFSTVIGLVQK